jgi:hypothetical protein
MSTAQRSHHQNEGQDGTNSLNSRRVDEAISEADEAVLFDILEKQRLGLKHISEVMR